MRGRKLNINYESKNRQTVNYLKALTFEGPAWTPCNVSLLPATWIKYRDELEDVVLAHPRLWPKYKSGAHDFDEVGNPLYEVGRRTDSWGTVWENIERGMDSIPIEYPLENWADFEGYTPPDPRTEGFLGPQPSRDEIGERFEAARKRGGLARGGGLPHGFFYMRLFYLRGFENLMLDIATGDPRLQQMIDMIVEHNLVVINAHLELGAEMMGFGEDLGLQHSLPMSPEAWRTWIKPGYDRMFRPIRERSIPIYLHSDGHILEIMDDLVDVGVTAINPQFRANGLDGLRTYARGKLAINLDLDRQLFPFASPQQITDHIGEAHDALVLPEGGLMLVAECAPDVPLQNIDAICSALEDVCGPPEA